MLEPSIFLWAINKPTVTIKLIWLTFKVSFIACVVVNGRSDALVFRVYAHGNANKNE